MELKRSDRELCPFEETEEAEALLADALDGMEDLTVSPPDAASARWPFFFFNPRHHFGRLRQNFENLREYTEDPLVTFMLDFLQTSFGGIVFALEAKDPYSGQHSVRVAMMSSRLGEVMKLGPNARRRLEITASIHDIGKIGIPDAVLMAPRKLTDEEFAIMKSHAEVGANILQKTLDNRRARQVPEIWLNQLNEMIASVRGHHERYDGKGYPDGLAGEEIPAMARMIAICDSADAMMSNRVYRNAPGPEIARSEIRKNRGIMYDPVYADAMLEHWEEITEGVYETWEEDRESTET